MTLISSTVIDSISAPYSVGGSNKGKDITIIVYGTEEESQKATQKVK